MAARQNQVYHFAFRYSIQHDQHVKNQLITWLRGVADRFIFQAEDTKNNPHYQGYFHTKTKKRPRQLAISVNDQFRGIEIQPASNNGKNALQEYCMKEDTRVAGPWADKRLYLGKDLWPEAKMPEWQRHMLQHFSTEPDDRTMYWVYDPVGNNGKTKFIKYLAYKKDALGLAYGHATDILNLVSKFQNKWIYAWNLTRTKPANLSELDLYAAMESIKDGFFINTKYETAQVMMNPPHIMVCANHLPNLQHISRDRWVLYEIRNSALIRLNLVEVQAGM